MKKLLKLTLALALPALFMASVAGAEAATPAVPGGGNPAANSDNAATPAVPAVHPDMPGTDDMQGDEAGKFADGNPGLRDEAKAKWDGMTPDERKAFLKDHPKVRRAILKKQWDKMSPADRGAFLENHPEMKEKLKARWAAMTPEERQAFLASHPKIEKRWKKAHAKRADARGDKPADRGDGVKKNGNNGVRDHGQGEGRNGAGQGKGQGMTHGRK